MLSKSPRLNSTTMETGACADEISDNRRVTNRCSAYVPARVISLDACGDEKACEIPPLTFAPRCAESINSECYPSVDTCREVARCCWPFARSSSMLGSLTARECASRSSSLPLRNACSAELRPLKRAGAYAKDCCKVDNE